MSLAAQLTNRFARLQARAQARFAAVREGEKPRMVPGWAHDPNLIDSAAAVLIVGVRDIPTAISQRRQIELQGRALQQPVPRQAPGQSQVPAGWQPTSP